MVNLLLDLPLELLHRIIMSLDYVSALALQLSCRHLCAIVKTLKKSSQPQLSDRLNLYHMTDLLEIELWSSYHFAAEQQDNLKQPVPMLDFFACYICLKIKSAEKFSNAMMKGKRGKLSPNATEKIHRFCIPCGTATGRYHKGSRFRFGGNPIGIGGEGIICYRCGRFEKLDDPFLTRKVCTLCTF
jgi:hypothetical protein